MYILFLLITTFLLTAPQATAMAPPPSLTVPGDYGEVMGSARESRAAEAAAREERTSQNLRREAAAEDARRTADENNRRMPRESERESSFDPMSPPPSLESPSEEMWSRIGGRPAEGGGTRSMPEDMADDEPVRSEPSDPLWLAMKDVDETRRRRSMPKDQLAAEDLKNSLDTCNDARARLNQELEKLPDERPSGAGERYITKSDLTAMTTQLDDLTETMSGNVASLLAKGQRYFIKAGIEAQNIGSNCRKMESSMLRQISMDRVFDVRADMSELGDEEGAVERAVGSSESKRFGRRGRSSERFSRHSRSHSASPALEKKSSWRERWKQKRESRRSMRRDKPSWRESWKQKRASRHSARETKPTWAQRMKAKRHSRKAHSRRSTR